jgi:two-component system chemotaxis response regulator CheY
MSKPRAVIADEPSVYGWLRLLGASSRTDGSGCMPLSVLVVDDSVTMLLSLKTTLSMNGFEVQTANNGLDALTKLSSGFRPNLILTDINMPVMGGMELIGKVRALPSHRFIPILTLTTESEASKREEGKRLGATGWLVKPVSGDDLVRVIRKVLPGA